MSPLRAARRSSIAAALGAAWLLACSPAAPTQLVVVVDSDYEVPAEAVALRLEARDGTGRTTSDVILRLVADDVPAAPGETRLPTSFGVVPLDGDPSRRVEVVAELIGKDSGRVLVSRRARTGFIDGRALLLPLFLARACEAMTCGDGTCDRGSCVPTTVDPRDLRPVRPGGELRDATTAPPARDDASMPDPTARDAGWVDPGLIDAGTVDDAAAVDDAATVDAGDVAPSLDSGVTAVDAGACVPACPPDESCRDGVCVPRADCRRDACPAGSYCTATGTCAPGCDHDAACGAHQRCDLTSHACTCVSGYEPCAAGCCATDPMACREPIVDVTVLLGGARAHACTPDELLCVRQCAGFAGSVDTCLDVYCPLSSACSMCLAHQQIYCAEVHGCRAASATATHCCLVTCLEYGDARELETCWASMRCSDAAQQAEHTDCSGPFNSCNDYGLAVYDGCGR